MGAAGPNSAVSPLFLDCPRAILRDIAAFSTRSRWSKHGGLCGVLYGTFDGSFLRVRAWRAGNPAPKRGRMFVDLHGDADRIEAILIEGKQEPPLQALQPAGCFFARGSAALELPEPSREVYRRLFPEPWQVALTLRLDGRNSTAQFFGRTGHPRPPGLLLPSDAVELHTPRRGPLLVTAILGWLLVALAGLALLRPDLPLRFLPVPPALGLRLSSSPGALAVLWNRQSPLLLGSARATLEIHDSGQYYTYELNPGELERGTFAFAPRGSDVEVEMTAYPSEGAPASEFARFVTALGK